LRGRLDERLPVEGFRLQVASRCPAFSFAPLDCEVRKERKRRKR